MAKTPTDTNGGDTDAGGEAQAAAQNGEAPSLRIVAQYLKDLSFENPNAHRTPCPATIRRRKSIFRSMSMQRHCQPNDYEIELHLEAKAEHEDAQSRSPRR